MKLIKDVQYLYQHNQIFIIDAHITNEELDSTLRSPKNNILFIEFPKSAIYDLFVDPHLSKYNTVVINYNFNVYVGLLIALLKHICVKRADLKLIIINSTPSVIQYFDTPGYLQYYPKEFDVYYLDMPASNLVNTIIFSIYQIYNSESGTLLVFCSSATEMNQIQNQLKLDNIQVQIVAGNKKPEFNKNRIILSINAGIPSDFVIDAGIVRNIYFNGVYNTLITESISKKQAIHRAQFANSKVFRLYTEIEYGSFKDYHTPMTDLSPIVYLLLNFKVKNPLFFDFPCHFDLQLLNAAVVQLYRLQFISMKGVLIKPGHLLKEVPLHPQFLKVILTAFELKCLDSCLKIIAMCHVKELYATSNRKQLEQSQYPFRSNDGDLLSYLTIYDQFVKRGNSWSNKQSLNTNELIKATKLYKQCKAAIKAVLDYDFSPSLMNVENIKKSFFSGFFENVITLHGDIGYKRMDGIEVDIHPNSILYNELPKWLIYMEALKTTKLFVQHVMTIEWTWVRDMNDIFELKK